MNKNINKKKFRYVVLKALEEGKGSRLNDLGVTNKDRDNLLMNMQRDGLVRGFTSTKDGVVGTPEITIDGERYLQDNSKLKRTYEAAKEVRDWIPFLY